MVYSPIFRHVFSRTPASSIITYALAAFAVVAATGLRLLLNPALSAQAPYITFSLAIVDAGWIGGGGPAAFAVIPSALAADFFFLAPVHSLFVAKPDLIIGLTLFIVMGG